MSGTGDAGVANVATLHCNCPIMATSQIWLVGSFDTPLSSIATFPITSLHLYQPHSLIKPCAKFAYSTSVARQAWVSAEARTPRQLMSEKSSSPSCVPATKRGRRPSVLLRATQDSGRSAPLGPCSNTVKVGRHSVSSSSLSLTRQMTHGWSITVLQGEKNRH
jgi:hypothetical protein